MKLIVCTECGIVFHKEFVNIEKTGEWGNFDKYINCPICKENTQVIKCS